MICEEGLEGRVFADGFWRGDGFDAARGISFFTQTSQYFAADHGEMWKKQIRAPSDCVGFQEKNEELSALSRFVLGDDVEGVEN